MISKKIIEKYLLIDDMSTYDTYDVWKTKFGYTIKKGYNSNKFLYLIPASILTIFDFFINNNLRLFYEKQEYPIVRAQASIALLNLYQKNQNKIYLHYAKKHIIWLTKNSSIGFNGICWGLNFAWPAGDNLEYDANEPFTTHTPYVLEALDLYIECSNDKSFEIYITRIFDYYENDVKVMIENSDILAVSYGTTRDRLITNAVSYTLFSYSIFSKYIDNVIIEKKRVKLYNFIKNIQLKNGSWFYIPNVEDSFIDCFHTCFILKNLIKSNQINNLNGADKIIDDGFNYLLNNFYDSKSGLFRRFSISNKPSIVKFDLYDNAEVLNIFYLLEKENDFKSLNYSIVDNFFLKEDIYSIIDIFNFKRYKNTLRWAVIPYICSITKLN